jgi:hypothetical protein
MEKGEGEEENKRESDMKEAGERRREGYGKRGKRVVRKTRGDRGNHAGQHQHSRYLGTESTVQYQHSTSIKYCRFSRTVMCSL